MTKARREALELIQKMLQARKDALVYCINDKKRELHACNYALETMKRKRAKLQVFINKIQHGLRMEAL